MFYTHKFDFVSQNQQSELLTCRKITVRIPSHLLLFHKLCLCVAVLYVSNTSMSFDDDYACIRSSGCRISYCLYQMFGHNKHEVDASDNNETAIFEVSIVFFFFIMMPNIMT